MHSEQILILAKTYPVPSSKYDETVCVAGINQDGAMRRLFPVQFRYLEGEKQFKKWQWINAQVKKAPKDHRRESHIINSDSIKCGETIATAGHWKKRLEWLKRIPAFTVYEEMEAVRQKDHITLALLKPHRMTALDITPEENPEWTEAELNKLRKYKQQGELFERAWPDATLLEKIPFSFHYRYVLSDINGCSMDHRHKILDWEVCALY